MRKGQGEGKQEREREGGGGLGEGGGGSGRKGEKQGRERVERWGDIKVPTSPFLVTYCFSQKVDSSWEVCSSSESWSQVCARVEMSTPRFLLLFRRL